MLYKTRRKFTTFFTNNNNANKKFHSIHEKENKKWHIENFHFLKFKKKSVFVNFCLPNTKINLQKNV